jgi:hypothetical protein
MGNMFEIRPANEEMNRLVAERSAAVVQEGLTNGVFHP